MRAITNIQRISTPTASGLGGTLRRAAMMLLVMMLMATTAWAETVTLTGSNSYTAQDGDVLTGSTSGTVTLADGAIITLSGATITGGIVCAGSATITLAGTNSVKGANLKAGIQVGGSGSTLTIRGDGSLTATGGMASAGIGLSRAWSVDATGGNIVIEGGNITALGGPQDEQESNPWGAGIGTGATYNAAVTLGDITIKGGTVTATGYNGIGTGYTYSNASNTIGAVTIYDTIAKVDASSISKAVTYMHVENGTETDVTANVLTYFLISRPNNRYIIEKNNTGEIIVPLGGNDNYTAQDGDVLAGTTSGTVTITDGASITLRNATITGGIVCAGSATITLSGTNSVKGANLKAGIQVGGSGTTLTIRGDGSLTATGNYASAGIGLSYAKGGKDDTNETFIVKGGNIVIESGSITAIGGPLDPSDIQYGAGIGTGEALHATASLGDITIKGGTVTATGYNGIGKGDTNAEASHRIGTIKIYNTIDMVDASSISKAVIYMRGETDVNADVTAFFNIVTDGSRRVITPQPAVKLSGSYTAQDRDILTGLTPGTVTIADGASITLRDATITGGIVCAGTATITNAGTNSVTGTTNKAGIQIGGTGTTLTFMGHGSLTATGGESSAGIGQSRAESDAAGGDIVIKSGTVTATGYNGIGKGYCSDGVAITIGAVKIYDTIDMVDASSFSEAISYMHDETDVTASADDYFTTYEDGGRHKIVRKELSCIIADGTAYDYNRDYNLSIYKATYTKTLGAERVGKYQAWMVPFDYTITAADTEKFTFYKINMIANSPSPSVETTDEMWVFLTRLGTGDVLHGNMPYVYKPLEAVTDYEFTIMNATKMAKNTSVIAKTETVEDIYAFYATYENTTATASDPFYYVNNDGSISLGNDGTETVGPYRWIIRKTNKFSGTPNYAHRMYFYYGESSVIVPTGIKSATTLNGEKWYDLQGRKLSNKPTQSGVYINNGKKIVIK